MLTSTLPALLAAKLRRPTAPRHWTPRPALVARLNAGLEAGRPLALIAAPAGYGKTTLAAAWVEQLGRPAAWLTLDEADDDPLRFFTYFLAALQEVDPSIGAELLPLLRAGQVPPPRVLAITLLNDLIAAGQAGREPLVCVLDDFHLIQDAMILGALQEMLALPASGLRLTLVTREDPALPLARLRARDQLTEVRAADLRFAQAEVAAFLREGMGLALSDRDLARLAERTEGWPAGLQLAAVAMRSSLTEGGDLSSFVETFSGSHRFILSYLTEEVLASQPAIVQAFLLRTSILDRLCGPLCDAVSGVSEEASQREGESARRRVSESVSQQGGELADHELAFRPSSFADSQEILAHLERANVFLIPLDDEGSWYRYHHLFAELLRGQLRRRRPDLVAELHRRASRWYEVQGMPAEAIHHALAAGDHDHVVALLEAHCWALLNAGYARAIESWVGALPPALRERSPRINLDFAWMDLLRGNFERAGTHLAQAETALARQMHPAATLQAECLALQANLLQAQGRAAEAIAVAERALTLVAPQDQRVVGLASLALGGAHRQIPAFDRAAVALWDAIRASRASGDLVTEMLAVSHLTLMAVQHGRLRLAAEVAMEALARLEREGAAFPPIVGAVHGALGLVYYEQNQPDKARDHLQRGIRLSALSGHNASAIYSQCNLARLLQADGDLDGAARALEAAAALWAQGAPGWVWPELVARRANLALARGDLEAAEAFLRQSGVAMDDPVTLQTDAIHLAWLRLLAARADARASDLAQRIIRSAEAGGRNGALLQALVLAARLHADQPSVARRSLARALALAEPEGAARAFLDEGDAIAVLLRRIGCPPWLEQHLPSRRPVGKGEQRDEALIEPLSEREREVLRLLAAGLTYAEIAERLLISVNTVRFHVKEIYGKLGVNRQAQAVARARELGWLGTGK